ncbi:hypothetical protein JCM11251_005375 [Rhodosporidiobolus azoricus]
MKTAFLSVATLPFLAQAVSAIGIVDMASFAVKAATQAIDLNGEYYVQNVKTGEYMYFERPGDTTNLVAGKEKKSVTIGQDSKYGQSGVNWDHWQGSYFTGLDKCVSAQWGEEGGLGVDLAAVSYACKVGPDHKDGTDTLEVAKQFWHAIPCGSSSSSSSDSSSDSDDGVANVSNIKLNAAVQKSSSSGSSSSVEWSKPAQTTTEAAQTTTSSAADATQSRDPNNRWTWECLHPAWWLARHPEYVWDQGKVECQSRLMDYYNSLGRMHRRSRSHEKRSPSVVGFGENPNKLDKRGETTYCIIAVDHLTDMVTRAITPAHIATVGGYDSLKLANYDKDNEEQHWRITQA